MKHAIQLFRIILACLVLVGAGCLQPAMAADKPSHESAISQIRQALPDNDLFTVTNLRYANGYAMGVGQYVVVVTCRMTMKVSSDSQSGANANSNLNSAINAFSNVILLLKLGHFEPGDYFDEAQEYIFQDTENGWILQGPKGDSQTISQHTPNAAAAQVEKQQQEQHAKKEARREEQQFHANLQAKMDAIAQACAAGQPLHVTSWPRHPQDIQGAGTLEQWVYQGQVVTPIPDGNRPYMCHVQYATRKHIVSGYINFNNLGLN